jgi:hypothetical protein
LMGTQQYHVGETVEATISFLHGDRVSKVTATFVHADDPVTKFYLSGRPEEETATEGAGYTYYRVVLSGDITVEDKLGTYYCEVVEAEYSGGLKVPFGGIPNVGFEIAEADIPPPEIVSNWEWGAAQR